eukprot:gnl/Chilomastix_cuspidata/7389.p2 GENE.gnl/Chilomastix_cuspidata/7389~~gnl/Chilomastix_cuspidata/7389.p2  ORF type:complete len:128 (+),score=11.10 gnl/Chilomastix_cuspidata/7389:319-702(+)
MCAEVEKKCRLSVGASAKLGGGRVNRWADGGGRAPARGGEAGSGREGSQLREGCGAYAEVLPVHHTRVRLVGRPRPSMQSSTSCACSARFRALARPARASSAATTAPTFDNIFPSPGCTSSTLRFLR